MLAVVLMLACALDVGAAPAAETAAPPAPAARLSEGDVAPAPKVERWLRGRPIERFEPGRVYVLEFAAPWCGPCLEALPRLSAMEDRLRSEGVNVLAVFGPDTAGTTQQQVESLIADMGDVRVSIAFDARAERLQPALGAFFGHTAVTYLEGAGLAGVPAAFVVDREGRVAWIGPPAAAARVVDEIVKGVRQPAGDPITAVPSQEGSDAGGTRTDRRLCGPAPSTAAP